MPGRKAAGLDTWTLQELRQLQGPAREALAKVMNPVEGEGQFPPALSGSHVVFLLKREGDDPFLQRPIGILPMLCRLWAWTI